MTRGNVEQVKCVYQGGEEDFVVFIDSKDDLAKWKGDRSIPLAQVVSGFKVLITHKHGAQGILDTASKSTLENEFGTSNEDECIIKILEKGQVQTVKASERTGTTNDSKGSRDAH